MLVDKPPLVGSETPKGVMVNASNYANPADLKAPYDSLPTIAATTRASTCASVLSTDFRPSMSLCSVSHWPHSLGKPAESVNSQP